MKPNPIFFIFYGGIVFLDGAMAYFAGRSGLIEILAGLVLFAALPWIIKEQIAAEGLGLAISIGLLIYYSYYFAATTYFFSAALGLASFFMSLYLVLKIFR